MTRRILTDEDEDDKNYLTLVTGGPTKYHNRRRVRKVFADKLTLFRFEPIKGDWFQTILGEVVLARHRKRLTQLNLAILIGTSQAEMSRIECGKTNPTIELLDRIFTVLDLSVEIKIQQK
jgi:DNA-binding XRE family transcriptional regulator